MKIFELPACNGRKSFYGKAHIIEQDDGTKILQSYNTQVAKLTSSGEECQIQLQHTSRVFASFTACQ